MAKFIDVKLSGNLEGALARYEKSVKEKVLLAGVAAMAKVLYDEVKINVTPPRIGIKTGNLYSSIYRAYSPEKSGDDVKTYHISWNKSKAPHGHLLEFGTSRMAARPFVRPAFGHVRTAIAEGKAQMVKALA